MEALQKLGTPERITIVKGNAGLPKVNVATRWSTAEIYLHGAQITAFQKKGEPPFLFLSRLSRFAPTGSIRGGVPICFPWFGARAGDVAHGFARLTEWDLADTAVTAEGAVRLKFNLPTTSARAAWRHLRVEFTVTVSDQLTMEMVAVNESGDGAMEFENCLHTYFHVGDIGAVSITGLEGVPFDDFAAGANGARKPASDIPLRITRETNRVYPHTTSPVEIRDESLQRVIRIEKFNSQSTVVWNPWTTQRLPDDFDPAEHKSMVCVESGNVKQNKIMLAPGKTAALKVVLSSRSL